MPQSGTPRGRYTGQAPALILLVTSFCGACKDHDSIDPRTWDETIAAIRDSLKQAESAPVRAEREYSVECFHRVLSVLESNKSRTLAAPEILTAIVSPDGEGEKSCTLWIRWIEEGYSTCGFRLVARGGQNVEYSGFVWPSESKRWFGSLFRDQTIRLVDGPRMSPQPMRAQGVSHVLQIELSMLQLPLEVTVLFGEEKTTSRPVRVLSSNPAGT